MNLWKQVKESWCPTDMVAYQGGKYRLGSTLAGIINDFMSTHGLETYTEPFFGCGGVTRHIKAPVITVTDNNADLLQLWLEVREGKFERPQPEQITPLVYAQHRNNNNQAPNATRAFFGLFCSAAYRYMGSFVHSRDRKPIVEYVDRHFERFTDEATSWFAKVHVLPAQCYSKLSTRHNQVIYADPPYHQTQGYWDTGEHKYGRFDAQAFWQVANQWAEDGNYVFVSYNTKPLCQHKKWTAVWTSEYQTQSASHTHVRTEYLWFRGPDQVQGTTESQPMDAE